MPKAGGGARGGGGFRGGGARGGFRGGRGGGMRMGGGGFRRAGGFPRHRRFFGRGGAFFAPGGGWWGGGYPSYWWDWDYPLYLIEDEEEREEARLFREQLAQQAVASAAAAAASAAVAQAAAAQAQKKAATKGLGIFGALPKMAHPIDHSIPALGARINHGLPAFGAVGLGALSWRNTSYDAGTADLQKALNVQLKRFGYNSIDVDGKLGPATCGAYGALAVLDACRADGTCDALMDQYSSELLGSGGTGGLCQSFTYPSKVGSTKAETPEGLKTVTGTVSTELQPAWGSTSAAVRDLQNRLNPQLIDHGKLPIPVNGMLDAVTCGAMRYVDQVTGQQFMTLSGGNCKSFTLPTDKPTTEVAMDRKAAEVPAIELAPKKPGFSAAAMVGGIGIIAAIGAALYTSFKPK